MPILMEYSEKLKDPRWQKKRNNILIRDNYTCQRCLDETQNLQVHHIKYTGEPWEAPDEDLETLCCNCHKVETEVNKNGDTIVSAYKDGNNIYYKTKDGKLVLGCIKEGKLKLPIVISKPKYFIEIINALF